MLGREPFARDEPGRVEESPIAAFGSNRRVTHAQDSDTAGDLQQHLDETLARSAEGSWHLGYLARSEQATCGSHSECLWEDRKRCDLRCGRLVCTVGLVGTWCVQ